MKPAFYMRFAEGHQITNDRIGGLPSHLPSRTPIWEDTGSELVFLAQFYSHPERLDLGDGYCLQVYQNVESYTDTPFEYEPYVSVVLLPQSAPMNLAGAGQACPNLRPFSIDWVYREDPDDFGVDYAQVIGSKAQGTCCLANYIREDEKLLITLEEHPLGLNFGGNTLFVILNSNGEIEARLDR